MSEEKEIQKAVKAEQRRISMALKEVAQPEDMTKKQFNTFMREIKAAIAAPADEA